MLDRLEMFIALANERHFGRAAEVCGVSQPSLSSAIRQLEAQLGVQLVRRGSRFEGLTPEGEQALARALAIVADARALREEMRAARTGLSGVLRIGVIPTVMPLAADLTGPFAAAHPSVRLTLLSRTSEEIVAQIDRLDLDAGLSYLDPAAPGRLLQIPLWREDYRLLTAAQGPLARRESLTWAEVGAQPLCLLTQDMQNRRIIDGHLAAAGVAARAQVDSNSVIALVAHVRTGRWNAVVPVRMAELFAGGRELASVPIEGQAGHPVGLIAAARGPHPPALAALIAAARRLGTA